MIFKNKKISFVLFAVLVCAFVLMNNKVFAATCGGVATSIISCEEGGDGGVVHILRLAIDILSIGVGILAVVGISWSGVQYLTAREDTGRATKAKRRLFEIVIGIVLFVSVWGLLEWLLPGSRFGQNGVVESGISISYSGAGVVGRTFTPTVSFVGETTDKTYSLISNDSSIIAALGRSAKCVDVGTTTVSALSASGKKASINIQCKEETEPSSGSNRSDSGSGSNGKNEIVGSMMNTAFKGNSSGKPYIRKETKEIIKDRKNDFFFTGDRSYQKVVLGKKSKYGSYEKYVSSLGGVFSRFASTNRISVKTAADYQIAAEYVFGLLTIWGPDYYNGKMRQKWVTNDAFYKGYSGRSSLGYTKNMNVNKLLKTYSTAGTIDIHCDKGINILLRSTSLKFPPGGASNGEDSKNRKINTIIKKVKDLQVGDIVNFPGHHTVAVGEVYKNKIVLYDVGNWFQSSKSHTYKQVINRKNGTRLSGKYSMFSEWYGWRVNSWKIDQSKTLGGIN